MTLVNLSRVLVVDDTQGPVQWIQIDLGPNDPTGVSLGIRDKTPRVGEYGLASNPPAQSHAVVLTTGGDRTNSVVIATNHQQSRPTGLQPGESALYNGIAVTRILLGANEITVEANGQDITVNNAGTVTLNCSAGLQVNGWLKVSGDITDNTAAGNAVTVKQHRDDYNEHTHPDVQSGGSSTGATSNPAT